MITQASLEPQSCITGTEREF